MAQLPRSRKEHKYIRLSIGISLKSILFQSLFSSSAVSCGGGGREESPPKSKASLPSGTTSLAITEAFSASEEYRFSTSLPGMIERMKQGGQRALHSSHLECRIEVRKTLSYPG